MAKKKLHCGHPGRSQRLARMLNVMIDLRSATSLQLQKRTGSMAVHADISDLRQCGYPISKAHYLRTTDEGRKIYAYQWEGK